MSHFYIITLTDEQTRAIESDGHVHVKASCAQLVDDQLTVFINEGLHRNVALYDASRPKKDEIAGQWHIGLNPEHLTQLRAAGGGFKNVPLQRVRPSGELATSQAWVLGEHWNN